MQQEMNSHSNQTTVEHIECMIKSEYDELEVVLVHRPGPEIDRLTPLNKEKARFLSKNRTPSRVRYNRLKITLIL